MPNKIIITIRDDTPDLKAVNCVAAVMRQGRISTGGESYCYVAEFEDGIMVAADRTKTADTFKVWKGEKRDVR